MGEYMPPIGATPYKVYAVDRINELLGAIGRYMNEVPLTNELVDHAKKWAVELEAQIDLISSMMLYDD